MTTGPRRSAAVLAPIALVAMLAVGGCSGSATATSAPQASTPAAAPSAAAPVTTDPSIGGGSGGDPGTGVGLDPVLPTPVDPAAGQPNLVRPLPGRQNPHPVTPTALQASVDGRHVLVKVTWYGGVEPCSVLDSVTVDRSGMDIAITPVEGSSDPTAICIEIAMLKATIVDLGELEPGMYRIASPGSDAPPIEITIS